MAGKLYGILAEFENVGALYRACEGMRDAGYRDWDAHSPFPVHGIEKAMGFSWSNVPYFSAAFGFTGAAIAFLGQSWVAAVAYPVVISAKPMISWPAFIPVTFEVGILSTAIGTLLGLAVLAGLPSWWHPLFTSEAFERFSDDAFFISVESKDRKFDLDKTRALLEQLGATNIELVEV